MKKGPGNQHCSDLSATLPLSRFQRQLPSERGAEENYLETLNLNVLTFFVSLCFQGFQRLAFCAYTLLTLYFLVLLQLYTGKRPARQAVRLTRSRLRCPGGAFGFRACHDRRRPPRRARG